MSVVEMTYATSFWLLLLLQSTDVTTVEAAAAAGAERLF